MIITFLPGMNVIRDGKLIVTGLRNRDFILGTYGIIMVAVDGSAFATTILRSGNISKKALISLSASTYTISEVGYRLLQQAAALDKCLEDKALKESYAWMKQAMEGRCLKSCDYVTSAASDLVETVPIEYLTLSLPVFAKSYNECVEKC